MSSGVEEYGGDWALGIGDWGLRIGDCGEGRKGALCCLGVDRKHGRGSGGGV